MTTILAILIILVVAGVAYWAVDQLAAAFGFPAPLVAVARVLIVVVAIWYAVTRLGLL